MSGERAMGGQGRPLFERLERRVLLNGDWTGAGPPRPWAPDGPAGLSPEARELLPLAEALGVSPHDLLAAGTRAIEWQGRRTYAAEGEWILGIEGLHGQTDAQVSAAQGMVQRAIRTMASLRGAPFDDALTELRVTRTLGTDGVFTLEAPASVEYGELVNVLRAVPGFAYVEPNFVVWAGATFPDDPMLGDLWGLHNTGQAGGTPDADIDAPEAWDIHAGSYTVRVLPAGGTGEYVLIVSGDTGEPEPFTVIGTDVGGGTFSTAPGEMRIDFSHEVLLSSLDAGDLVVEGRPAAGVTVVDGDTVVFDLPRIALGRCELEIPSGAILDVRGQEIEPFTTDITVAPLSLPPSGGLIYRVSAEGTLSPAAPPDELLLTVDPGRTVTVAVEPAEALQPTVELRNPSGGVVASGSASEPGEAVVIQAVPTGAGGPFRLAIGRVDETSGDYALDVLLDSAAEAEAYCGPGNDERASAEDIDAAFIALGGGGERAAVVGSVHSGDRSVIYADSFESGGLGPEWSTWTQEPGGKVWVDDYDAGDGSYALFLAQEPGCDHGTGQEADLTADLRGYSDVELHFLALSYWDSLQEFDGPFTGHCRADGVAISGDGLTWYPLCNGPGNDTEMWLPFDLDVSAAAAEVGIPLGEDLRFRFQQFGHGPAPVNGRGYDQIIITGRPATTDPEDWYRFTLGVGQAATVALSGLWTEISIHDETGTLLATGQADATNLDRVIADFTAPEAGEYYVRVVGAVNEYSLVVTRSAGFDIEPNDGRGHAAQGLAATGVMLGALTQVDPAGDYYRFDAEAGSELSASTTTPGVLSQVRPNELDPALELYDPSGALVASDDNSAPDGRNAELTHQAGQTGSYTLRVLVAEGTGEYVLTVSGHAGEPEPFVVVGTDIGGAMLPEAPAEIRVDFSHPIQLSSLDPGDLVVMGVPATDVTVVDGDTVRFHLPRLFLGMFDVEVPAGAITDVRGMAIEAFATDFTIFPADVPPLGGLIYSHSATGTVPPAGTPDELLLTVNSGQTMTVMVAPSAGLKPTVELRDPAGGVVAGGSAPAAGKEVVLQTVPLAADGMYTLAVGQIGGTSGDYTIEVVLNAAVEAESHGGGPNDDVARAQDIEGAFVELADGAYRTAVTGGLSLLPKADEAIASDDFESGELGPQWSTYIAHHSVEVAVRDTFGAAEGQYALIMRATSYVGMFLTEAIWTVDLSETDSPVLSFWHGENGDPADGFDGDFRHHKAADGIAISDNGYNWHPIFDAPDQPDGVWQRYALDLAAEAEAAGVTLGPGFHIKFQAKVGPYSSRWRGWDGIVLSNSSDPDVYEFTLEAGEAAMLAATATNGYPVRVELLNASGTVLAAGVGGAETFDNAIIDFVVPSAGDYYARVDGGAGAEYSLVVTRNAVLDGTTRDQESYDGEDITIAGAALGVLGTPWVGYGWAWYTFEAAAGGNLTLTTVTPGDGPYRFAGLLDPKITLHDPAGTCVGSNDNGAPDGRNARVEVTAAMTGTYAAHVTAALPTSGTYVLKLTGHTGGMAPFEVISTDPPDGAELSDIPTEMTVEFSDPVLLTTLDADDLTVNGVPAVGYRLIDGQTVAFELPSLVCGHHVADIAAGAVASTQGQPVGAYQSGFTVPETSFEPIVPLGSMVYDKWVLGSIAWGGGETSYPLEIHEEQTVAVTVEPEGTLRASVALYDPSGVLVASAEADAAGQTVFLQTVALNEFGTHRLCFSGLDHSGGGFATRIILNAGLEAEACGGPANDDLASAEDLGPGFIDLDNGISRADVLGSVGLRAADGFESGLLGPAWSTYASGEAAVTEVRDDSGRAFGDFALLVSGGAPYGETSLAEAIWTVDLSSLTEATLSFWIGSSAAGYVDLPTDFTGHCNATGIAISDDGTRWRTIWRPGAPVGEFIHTRYDVDLVAEASAAGMELGPDFHVKLQAYNGHLVCDELRITGPDGADLYEFALGPAEPAAVAVTDLSYGDLSVELLDASGALLAAGRTGATNLDQAIGGFVAPAGGTYYLRVTAGDDGAEYSLLVMRGADFDTEPNNQPESAQDITASGAALGEVGTGLAPLFQLHYFAGSWIVERDPADGCMVRSFANPVGALPDHNMGIATTDATVLLGGSVDTPIVEVEYGSWDILREIPNPGYDIQGLAYLNDEIFVLRSGGLRMDVLAYSSGELKRSVELPPSTIGYLAADATRLLGAGSQLYEVDPVTGELTELADYQGPYARGLGVSDAELFVSNSGSIFVFDLETLEPARVLEQPELTATLGADQGPVHDSYALRANAGDVLDISTATPGDAPGGFANQLDPMLELYDPTGALVASDDDSAADGRNAELTHAAAMSGSYVVRVVPECFTTGEYLLRASGHTGDDVAFRVTGTDPAGGAALETPPTRIAVDFSDLVDFTTLQAEDLTIDGLPATGCTIADGDTVVFDLPPILAGVHNVAIRAGSISDVQGTAIDGFAMQFAAGRFDFPVPLNPVDPPGSLIYRGSVHGTIAPAGDTNTYALDLDAGQTVTVAVSPDASLQPLMELYDPSGALMGSASAEGPGQGAVVQTLAVAAAGTHHVTVGGVDATTGEFYLEVTVNAAVGRDEYGGPGNDSLHSAQDIDGGFIDLDGRGQVAAVVGKLPGAGGSEDFHGGLPGPQWSLYSSDSGGRIRLTDAYGAAGGSYALWMDHDACGSYALNEAIWTVDLTGFTQATLSFWQAEFNDEITPFAGDFEGHYEADGVAISDDGAHWRPVWSAVHQPHNGVWHRYEIDLAAEAADAGMTLGPDFRIKFQQYDDCPLTWDGRGWDRIAIAGADPSQDWYALSLDVGETVTLTGTVLDEGTVELELYDAGETLIGRSLAVGTNVDVLLDGFRASEAGTYYVRVTGAVGTPYSLVITRNAAFDVEDNSAIALARDITETGTALGDVHTGLGRVFILWYTDSARWIGEIEPATGAVVSEKRLLPEVFSDALATTPQGVVVGTLYPNPLYVLDPDSLEVLRTIPNPGGDVDGLAFLSDKLYVQSGETINVLDFWTGQRLRTIPQNQGVVVQAGWAGALLGKSYTTVHYVDPDTGEAVALGALPHSIYDLGVVGNELFVRYDRHIYVHSLPDLTYVRTFDFEQKLIGTGADEGEPQDYYAIRAAAGDELLIRTATPAGGAGQFVNDLDPAIELYDPEGQLVAADDDSAADGRNAALTHTAAATGAYTVRVTANPGTGGEYVLSVSGHSGGTARFPTEFDRVLPLGSMIHESDPVVGWIDFTGDADDFALPLDERQTVAVVVQPVAGLQPVVELYGPAGGLIGSATAPAPGETAILQPVQTPEDGTYTLRLTGVPGSFGKYTARVLLNAAVEAEACGGASNDDLSSAQDIDASFIDLGGVWQGGVAWARVSGAEVPVLISDGFESGELGPQWTIYESVNQRMRITDEWGAAEGEMALLMDAKRGGDQLAEAVWTVDLSGIDRLALYFWNRDFNDSETPFAGPFVDHYKADGVALSDDGAFWYPLWDAADQPFGEWLECGLDLTEAATEYGLALGADSRVKFQWHGSGSIPSSGRGWDHVRIAAPPEDWFRFTLDEGESASLAIQAAGGGLPHLELYDPAGTLLAGGWAAANLSEVINDFRPEAGGTYYVRVTGIDVDYSLVVTRNAQFDTEVNDSIATGQDVTFAGAALGGLGLPDPGDYYLFSVSPGDELVIETATPAGGPGEFVNDLDPAVELYDPTGALVAGDDNGAADGRNARLTWTATEPGLYAVRVCASAGAGEYVLRVAGHTGDQTAFEVTATDPADGAAIDPAPAQMTVYLSDSILLPTLEPSDLTVDGAPATAVTQIAGGTLVFDLPAGLGEGTHEVAVAAGAILDLQGTPIEPYAGQFEVDSVPPVVTDSSIQEGGVVSPGDLTYVVSFNEPLDAGGLGPENVSLEGGASGSYTPEEFHYDPDTSTLTLTYPGLPEDSYTLTLFSGDGGFEDRFGWDLDGEPLAWPIPPNVSGDGVEGGDFMVRFELDWEIGEFPAALAAVDPPGSLIYRAATQPYRIAPPEDVDRLTLPLDAGQDVTLVVTPDAALQVRVELYGPSGALLAAASSGRTGQPAILHAAAAEGAGTYTIDLRGDSTFGFFYATDAATRILHRIDPETAASELVGQIAYRVIDCGMAYADGRLYLSNVPVPERSLVTLDWETTVVETVGPHGGYRVTALAPLGGVLYGFSYGGSGGVIGTVDQDTGAFTPLFEGAEIPDFVAADVDELTDTLYALDWQDVLYTVDVATGSATQVGPTGVVFDGVAGLAWHPNDGELYALGCDQPGSGLYRLDKTTGAATLVGRTGLAEADTLEFIPEPTEGVYTIELILNAAAEAEARGGPANDDLPSAESLDGAFTDLPCAARRAAVIGSAAEGADWYRFTLEAGRPTTLAVAADVPDVEMEFCDASGTALVMPRAGAGSVDAFIESFVPAAAGTYYVRITTQTPCEYRFLVIQGAAFDLEPGDGVRQDLTIAGGVLGAIEDGDADDYRFAVQAGDELSLLTHTPAGGPGEFVNDLDPAIELYDPTGVLVTAADDSAADGRNAAIEHLAGMTGTYTVRVLAADEADGEYVLSVGGHTGQPPAFAVVASDPPDGTFTSARPLFATIEFSDPLLLPSVQAEDLTVDGSPAADFTVQADNVVRFVLPRLGEGTHEIAIAAGAISDRMGRPVEGFTAEVVYDKTPPAVAEALVNEGAIQRSVIYTLAFTFTEPVSVFADALSVTCELTGEPMDLTDAVFEYDEASATATWNLHGLWADFEDAYYTAGLTAGSVTDQTGNELDGDADGAAGDDFAYRFHRLAGDATGDAAVDFVDLGVLATEYGLVGDRLAADVNGDGVVNVVDLGILATNYDKSLA